MNLRPGYRWKDRKWICAVVGYWLLTTGLSGLVTHLASEHETPGTVGLIFFLLGIPFVSLPLFSDRSWGLRGKLLWLPFVYLLRMVFYGIAFYASLKIGIATNRADSIDRLANVLTWIPLILICMRRSLLFVKPLHNTGSIAQLNDTKRAS